jgi:glycine oxidase
MVARPLQIKRRRLGMKIAVVGAGSAGLFSAWYISQLQPDAELHIFDAGAPGQGATRAAAGMLAPVNELEFQELSLLHAGLASLACYHTEIVPALGEIGFRTMGTLEVPMQTDDVAYLRRLYDFQIAQGLPVEWLSGGAVQEVEPLVAPQIRQAILSRQDVQVDQWQLFARLLTALRARGAHVHPHTALRGWQATDDHVELQLNADKVVFDKVLLALGIPSTDFSGQLPYKIYPIKGEMLSLVPSSQQPLKMTVRMRSTVWGSGYVVPKADRILCGSTAEEKGHRAFNTAGGVLDILRKCYAIVPAIYELEIQEIWAGLRPATLDRLPVLDRQPGTQVYHLNGLYRHGILLGPIMGKAAATLLLKGERLPEVVEFGFDRPSL